ncbi:MAG: NADH-quinone oxidoreductase subunit A [Planctomycetes bacterium]|nr:NADH-quinone oxidoreductase subunit A [Planctomycetota bacterium]
MLFQYAHALIGLIFGMIFVALQVFVLVRLLSPRVKDPMKETTYECGEPPVGDAWVRFDMRFYTMALIFIIFEVEAVFLFPWAAVYNDLLAVLRDANHATPLFPFIEVFLFIVVLGVGLIYVWKKGDMDWVKSTLNEQERAWTPPAKAVTKPDTGRDVA